MDRLITAGMASEVSVYHSVSSLCPYHLIVQHQYLEDVYLLQVSPWVVSHSAAHASVEVAMLGQNPL